MIEIDIMSLLMMMRMMMTVMRMMITMRVMMTMTGMKGMTMTMMEMMMMTMRMQIDARQCGGCSFKSVFPNFTANCTLLTALCKLHCVNFTVLNSLC